MTENKPTQKNQSSYSDIWKLNDKQICTKKKNKTQTTHPQNLRIESIISIPFRKRTSDFTTNDHLKRDRTQTRDKLNSNTLKGEN